jgi:hypothetical protein
VPPVHLAPIAELLDDDAPGDLVFADARPAENRGLPLRQKRDKVAALDMRYQRYRRADP